MHISCVHCNVPKDLTLSTEERNHPSLPHLVVLPIEVQRTRSLFLLCHLWILDWLEPRKTRTDFDTNLRMETGDHRGGSEWEPIKILLKGDCYSNKMNTANQITLRLNYSSWPRPHSHWSATDPRNQRLNQPNQTTQMHSGKSRGLLSVPHRSG
jgi:hypothetical protein